MLEKCLFKMALERHDSGGCRFGPPKNGDINPRPRMDPSVNLIRLPHWNRLAKVLKYSAVGANEMLLTIWRRFVVDSQW